MSSDFAKQKAREISYALLRVAFYVKRTEFRFRLEVLAVELLENASRVMVDSGLENVNKALATVSVLDGLVRLGHSIYEIEPVNATILVRELDNLNAAIRKLGNPFGNGSPSAAGSSQDSAMKGELPNLERFFSRVPVPVSTQPDRAGLVDSLSRAYMESGNDNPSTELRINGNGNGVNMAIRQSAILNKIRLGNPSAGSGQVSSHLKNLIAEFPDVSERTIRYDLQRLCDQGLVERVGNGGPASFYRYKGN